MIDLDAFMRDLRPTIVAMIRASQADPTFATRVLARVRSLASEAEIEQRVALECGRIRAAAESAIDVRVDAETKALREAFGLVCERTGEPRVIN